MLKRSGPCTLADIDRALPQSPRTDGVLVVLAGDPQQVRGLRVDRSRWAKATLRPLIGEDEDGIHDALCRLANVDLVIDVRTSTGRRQLKAFTKSFLGLAPGATWVAIRSRQSSSGDEEPLVDLARRVQAASSPRSLPKRWREHARAIEGVHVDKRMVKVTKGREHLLKLRDGCALEVLSTREPELTASAISRLDGGVLEVQGVRGEHGDVPQPPFPSVLQYPPHEVRRYEGRIHLPWTSLAYHGRTVLPESFRWHLESEPVVSGLINAGNDLGRLDVAEAPSESLDGSYFFFHYNNPGHFGHLMTEALAKLWGWSAAKQQDPSLRILCRLHPRRRQTISGRLETRLLPAFGIDPDDIVWVDRPVTVETLVGCTPMWHNAPPYYVHPEIRGTWARLRRGLTEDAPHDSASKIFVTRREGKRYCTNVDAVERLFEKFGFDIVLPEKLSLPEQAAMFANARVVAGFGGAGMFNLVYAQRLEAVIALNHSAYWARNEQLFASVLGADVHSFWSEPYTKHPEDTFLHRAHRSDWEFDFERNGDALRQVLAQV